jgi:hypothetical protein
MSEDSKDNKDNKEQAVDSQKQNEELAAEDLKQVAGGAGAQASAYKIAQDAQIHKYKE